MTKIEKKFFEFISRNIVLVTAVAATVIGILLHIFGLNFESDDYSHFLSSWWVQIENSGFHGLATQVGNYNIPYQIITYLLTFLHISSLYAYKLLSIFFDFVLAVAAGMLVYRFDKNKKVSALKSVVAYAVVFCSATVLLNSSFWGQCDSIYCAFILLAIYFTHGDRNILAFVMLGIAFAFKLQMVFILPVFLFYYVAEKRISILHFFIIPAVDVIMCLPAVFLGRNITDIFTIYIDQTDYGKQIQMNCPNFWAFVCNRENTDYYYLFKELSILITILILGIAIALIIYKKSDIRTPENFLLASIWSIFTCIMFLSSMHERYAYLLDVLAVIYVFVTAKRLWLPVALQLISLRGYCYYLFSYDVLDIKLTSVIYIAIYAYVSYLFFKEVVFARRKNVNARLTVCADVEAQHRRHLQIKE